MATINVDLRNLDRVYSAWGKQVPFATSQALNDTAFKLKSDLESRAGKDMKMRRGKQALGIGIVKATKASLEAEVKSSRGWLEHQVSEGVATATTGITWKGKQYLLVPNKVTAAKRQARNKAMFSKRQTVVRPLSHGATLFVIMSRSGPKLMERISKGVNRVIGALVTRANYADDYKWEDQSNTTVRSEFGKAMAKRMEYAIATAR